MTDARIHAAPSRSPILDAIGDLVSTVDAGIAALVGAVRSRLAYAETVRQLEDLSERQLADVGLTRMGIYKAARTAAGAA